MIDRPELVSRYNPTVNHVDRLSLFNFGNGEFAFTDVVTENEKWDHVLASLSEIPNNNRFYQNEKLTVYLPGNSSLLCAVAMMSQGGDGVSDIHAPGFPQMGTGLLNGKV